MQYDCDKVHHGLESPEHNMGIMIQKKKKKKTVKIKTTVTKQPKDTITWEL
jgi:hypothetical protein